MKVSGITILCKPGLRILIMMCCWLIAPALKAQDFPFTEPQFERVSDVETLDNQPITALAQDARGLLWIGTQKGLIRYDGYRFRRFVHHANDPFSLTGDYVYALWAGPDGRIWVGGASDGISVFDPGTERFEPIHHGAKVPHSLSAGRIWAITGDSDGGIWVATEQGLDYRPRSGQGFVHFGHGNSPNSLLDDQVKSLLWDKTGRLWVGSNRGLQRMAKDGKRFATIITGKSVEALFQAQDGKLWLGSAEHGAAWLMPDGDAPTPELHWLPLAQLSHPWVMGIAQVQTGQIWLATRGGVSVVDASDGKLLQTLRHDASLPGSLALDSVKPMLLDQAGWLWLGTWGGGLQRINTNNTMLRVLRHSPKQPTSLSHPDIRSILELANGQLLFGSDGNGIDIFDRQRGLVGAYRPRRGDGTPTPSDKLPDGTVFALAQSADGTIWAGTRQAGLVRKSPGSSAWLAVPGLPGIQVVKLLVSRDGSLWAGTNHGVARWQASKQMAAPGPAPAQPPPPAPARFETISDAQGKPMQGFVNAMAEDEQGRIWIGTRSGLWLHDPGQPGRPGQAGLIAIPAAPEQPDSLISDYIAGLLFDSHGRLWLSTDKGMVRLQNWDGKRARFEPFSALLGQPDKALGASLMEDQAGRIWTGGEIMEPATMRIAPITQADGLDIGASWSRAYAKTRDGLLFFGGTQGVAIIDPRRYQAYDYIPPVVAVAFSINGQTTPLGPLASQPENSPARPAAAMPTRASLTLTPEQRSFALEFAALDYAEPKKNLYQYRLIGYEKDWINADADHRSAAYGNLPPGDYTLVVKGSNRLGEFSAQELRVAIQVLPAWWQTFWFRALLLLVLGSAIHGGMRWRVRGLRKKALALQNLVAARTADILNLSKIGQDLTATLDVEQAFKRVREQVSARLDAYVFSIAVYDEATEHIVFVYEIENQERMPTNTLSMSEHNRPAVWCVREQRELAVPTLLGLLDYVDTILPPIAGDQMESVVYLPLLVEQQVIGCLSVQSPRQYAYNPDQLEFLRVLASYTAIALSNSGAHAELTKSHASLAATHSELTAAHNELAATHQHLQETQQQLLLQEKMAGLGTLTAGVAHEINNPTHFAHVAAQILQTEIAEFEQFVVGLVEREGDAGQEILQAFRARFARLESNVSTVLYGTERIKSIVKDLRAFSRLDESEQKTVRISECLLSTVNLVRTSWQEQVEFITGFSDDPELECWPALLNQVFMNLLVNGCQAIAEKYQHKHQHKQRGKLSLRLRISPVGDALEIDFEDDGSGIDPAIHARIMEPFFTTKEVGSGSGLGLSTAFGIVKKHGGTLEFSSVPGEGSCFTVKLPLAAGGCAQ